ncbi:MAG: aldo/keto reductase [Chloroflexi bacterium]|nr:aldo/keto reductase [Chloroflexota bacterium]
METVRLANTDLVISRIGFGCGPLGGTDWGPFDEQESMASVSRAVDLGITFFDTADVYGLGRSERLLSRALAEHRHDVVIASKCGVNWEEGPPGQRARTFYDSSPKRVVEALENSLRRLRVDAIPLYFLHWPDPHTPLADTVEAIIRCQDAGKIRHFGLSNFSAAQIREVCSATNVAAVEMQYSLIDRSAEREILPCCRELGISAITYGSLAQGLLAGNYDAETRFEQDDRRRHLRHFGGEELQANMMIVRRLKELARQRQKSPAQLAMRWALDNPAVSGIIAGIRSRGQLKDNVEAQGWSLDPADYRYLVSG